MNNISTKISEIIFKYLGTSRMDPQKMQHPKREDQLATMKNYWKKYTADEMRIHDHTILTLTSTPKPACPHILYFHGGAYVWQGELVQWSFIKKMLRMTECRISYIDYPLAPEHTFQDTFAMVQEAYEILAEKYADDNFIFMGDSSGAGLALAFAEKIKKEKTLKQPVKLILLSPWLDLALNNPALKEYEKKDAVLTVEGLLAAGDLYAGGESKSNPLLSPIHGDLKGLREIAIFTGTHDILYPDCLLLKDKVEEVGGNIKVFQYTEMMHVWMLFPLPEAKDVLGKIKDLIEGNI